MTSKTSGAFVGLLSSLLNEHQQPQHTVLSDPTMKPGKKSKLLTISMPNIDALLSDDDLEALRAAPSLEDARELLWSLTATLRKRIISMGKQLDDGTPHRAADYTPQSEEEQAFVEWIFPLWAKLTRRPEKQAGRTKIRMKPLLARIREGRKREDFEAIIRWCASNDWMSGRDPKTNGRSYDDMYNLFGSPDKFDKYLALAQRASTQTRSSEYLRAGGPSREERTL